MKFAVIVFPGSNCDQDLYYAIRDQLGAEVAYVPHTATSLAGFDAVLIPGGFSYGDYLRCGAIARFAPIMTAVKQADEQNLPIVGICNGFQILTEAGLLPGSLQTNQQAKFICETTPLTITNQQTQFTSQYQATETIQLPIAHGEGNYYCDEQTLTELQANHQIVFEYGDNPNGSVANIAGIVNKQGNVLGMMPHPERAVENLLGSADGLPLFQSILQHFEEVSHA